MEEGFEEEASSRREFDSPSESCKSRVGPPELPIFFTKTESRPPIISPSNSSLVFSLAWTSVLGLSAGLALLKAGTILLSLRKGDSMDTTGLMSKLVSPVTRFGLSPNPFTRTSRKGIWSLLGQTRADLRNGRVRSRPLGQQIFIKKVGCWRN